MAEIELPGLKVTTNPLPFDRAQPLIPVVAEFLAEASKDLLPVWASGKLRPDDNLADPKVIAMLAPVIGSCARFLGVEDRLVKLTPKILATTVVSMESSTGDWSNFEMLKAQDRSAVFDKHPEAFFTILFFAGRVTFARFFPGRGRAAEQTPPVSG